jgi:hypothetical protein
MTTPAPSTARARSRALLLATLLGLGAASCGNSSAASEEEALADLQELVDALTPPPVDATSDVKDAHLARQRRVMEEMRGAGRTLGSMALQLVQERPEAPPNVRSGLLEVGALNVGAESAPILLEIFRRYEEPIDLRSRACELLPEVDPEAAVSELEPLVVQVRLTRTYPSRETMLACWSRACEALGRPRSEVLMRVATDIYQEDRARLIAIELLGKIPGNLERQTLEVVLVESTGNGLLRRRAAQALREQLPRDEACAIFERVIDLEADMHFQTFLASMITDNCP